MPHTLPTGMRSLDTAPITGRELSERATSTASDLQSGRWFARVEVGRPGSRSRLWVGRQVQEPRLEPWQVAGKAQRSARYPEAQRASFMIA